MVKKNIVQEPEQINETTPDETESEKEVVEEVKPTKQKRPITDKQREHLANIRLLAKEAKAKMREITMKAKQAKTIEKVELAKKYDDFMTKKEIEKKKQEEEEHMIKKQSVQQKLPVRKVKKIIYEDEDDEPDDYSKIVSQDNMSKLYNRALNERVLNSISAYARAMQPNYY